MIFLNFSKRVFYISFLFNWSSLCMDLFYGLLLRKINSYFLYFVKIYLDIYQNKEFKLTVYFWILIFSPCNKTFIFVSINDIVFFSSPVVVWFIVAITINENIFHIYCKNLLLNKKNREGISKCQTFHISCVLERM